jgi:serine/threonine-protein kinase ULK/ATG1
MKKVVTLKGWLPEGYNPPHIWIDRVIYDHALGLVCLPSFGLTSGWTFADPLCYQLRHTASVESRGENLQQCAEEYERALWMLSAIADDVLQEGNPYADQDRETIVSCMC